MYDYIAYVAATDLDTDTDILDTFDHTVRSYSVLRKATGVTQRVGHFALVAFRATKGDVSVLTHSAGIRCVRAR